MLDLLLSSDPNMVEEVEVGEHLGASDHNIVCAKTLLRVRVQDSRVRLFDFRIANFEGTRRELGDVDWETNNRTISIRKMGNLQGANVESAE